MHPQFDRCWFLTWTTYGSWLPGDPRGSVTSVRESQGPRIEHDQPDTPWESYIAGLYFASLANLKCDAICLNVDQAKALFDQFQETSTYRRYLLIGVAIMFNHLHMIVGVPGDPEPDTLVRDYKAYGSRALNRRWPKPASDTWWTAGGGSKRKLKHDDAIRAAIRYLKNQPNPLVLWIHPDWDDGSRGPSGG